MICEAFLRLGDGSVDGFENRQVAGNQADVLILRIWDLLDLKTYLFKAFPENKIV